MELTIYKCQNCKLLIKDPKRSSSKLSIPCPNCGDENQHRETWPSLDVIILGGLIKEQDLNDYKQQKVAIVFFGYFLREITGRNYLDSLY